MNYGKNVLLGVAACAVLLATSAQGQFQWAKRVASTLNPVDELSIGMTLDSQGNCYVTGWFDGTNDFGGVTRTSLGGQDIFAAKYDNSGALQWVKRAGSSLVSSSPYWDQGRGIGVDGAGNVYVTGGFHGSADFDTLNVSTPQNIAFFLAKYNSAGTVQWVRQSVGGTGDGVYGTGLAVDSAGNSYAVGFADNGATVTFGTTNLLSPSPTGYSAFLVKYDNAGTVLWAQLMGGPGHTYATKVAVDAAGNAYVHGGFSMDMTIGTNNLVSAGGMDMFIAKFDNAGALKWIRQEGGNGDEGGDGGVAVDPDGNVYVAGAFGSSPMNFGSTSLTNAGSWDAFIAKYNSSGSLQWTRRAGGTNLDVYGDVALDGQGNVYAAGVLGSDALPPSSQGGALVAKYDPAGILQWACSASSPPADPAASMVAKCAVDSAGNCFLAGWYQGSATFGTNVLQPQGYWNFFLAKLPDPAPTQFLHTTNNGAITITGYTGVGGVVTIPSTINGLPVTSIGDNAFQFKSSLTSVTIPNGLTNIGLQAFSFCGSLTNVTLPDSLISIGNYAFGFCTSLASITIPKNVTNIGGDVFASCSSLAAITVDGLNPVYSSVAGVLCNNDQTTLIVCPAGKAGSYTVPNSVTKIAMFAFETCRSLTNVTIPNSVTSIGPFAFVSCVNLSAITVGANNPAYSSAVGILFDKSQTMLIQYPAGKAGSYTVPDSVISIGDDAFDSCTSLTGITMPSTVKTIGSWAFHNCSSLTNVVIPNSVTNIGWYAFEYCYGLNRVIIPASLGSIAGYAFQYCSHLTSLTIPSSVTNIDTYAFLGCIGLKEIYFGGNAPNLGSSVFNGDTNATVYYLPGTTGWGATFGGRPAVLWNPLIQASGSSFGVRSNRFGFDIVGTANIPIVVEASTNLAGSVWVPLQSSTLTNGSLFFSDPQWTNYPTRFYRLRSP